MVLPDPWLTQEGLLTVSACALHQLFVSLCDMVHGGQHCSQFCAYTQRSLLQPLSFVPVFVSLCSQMAEPQNVRSATATTEWNHSYYTGNSLSALHSLQQLHVDAVSTPVHPLVSTQAINDTTSSGSVSGPQPPHGPTSSQVPAGPTRNVTGEAMPTSLAEAVTQLSFLEFLQRYNLLIAPPQPPQLPVPISLLDAAVQTTPPSYASQDVFTQTSEQPGSQLSFDVAVQTSFDNVHTSSLDAAVQTLPHNTQAVSTQLGSRPASSFSIDVTVQTLVRNIVLHDTSTQLPLTEFFIGCIFSNDPLDRQGPSSVQSDIGSVPLPPLILLRLAPSAVPALTVTTMSALWLHAPCCSHHRVSNSLPRPQVLRSIPTCAPHMAHLLIRYGCDPGYVQLSQSRPHSLLLVPSTWEHTLCAQPIPAREVLVLLWRERTILLLQILVQGLALFLNRALVLPLVHFGQSKPEGHGGIDTADSDLMHHQFRLSLLH